MASGKVLKSEARTKRKKNYLKNYEMKKKKTA